jgi:CO/xanthine dehydrogenase Mo-binding subunit
MTGELKSAIGRRIPKQDAPLKASGRAQYGHDVRLPGMLHGGVLYSQFAHAHILAVDTSKAEKVPGVKCVLTGDDNPGGKFGYGKDNTPFKSKVVRSLRDEIAGVVAAERDAVEEALSLIEVDYEPQAAVLSIETAMALDAPLVHRDHGSNLFQSYQYEHGDLDRGEADSAVTVEAELRLPYVTHVCLETSVVTAQFDPGGRLTLWSTTQIPFLLQRDLAEALGLEGRQIRILQTAIGGAFEGWNAHFS